MGKMTTMIVDEQFKKITGETSKAYCRRLKENWFERFAPDDKAGIDIGCQHDPLNHTFRRWDLIFGDGDVTFMNDVPDNSFVTVYASHVLEHLTDPITAVKNWWRILTSNGNLIVIVPHRDLYEKRKTLPSKWNCEHKSFWLPDTHEVDTYSLFHVLQQAIPEDERGEIDIRVIDTDYSDNGSDHASGEYSIEAIVRKK